MAPRQVQVHFHSAQVATPGQGKPPLLFVHGGYSHAQCWAVNFIPHFQALGYDCYAVDLSGHGASPGRDQLNEFGIDDYVADLAAAVNALPEVPVLIAHSMGCLVSQRYLEQGQARAVAFLAPVPPTGTGGTASRFALSQPEFFRELPNAVNGTADEATLRTMARVYFSPAMPAEDTLAFLPLIQPESDRAVAEMVAAPLRLARHRPHIPALVMGGSEDQVFPPSMLCFTSATWNARMVVIAGAGHMLMLDPQWPDAAAALDDWLGALA